MDQPTIVNEANGSGYAQDQGLSVGGVSATKRLSKRRWMAIGVIVAAVLVALGVGADFMWGQHAQLNLSGTEAPVSTPTPSVSTSPMPQTQTSTDTSDAQLDQDLQQANQSMGSLDQENQSADAGLNDQAPNLTY